MAVVAVDLSKCLPCNHLGGIAAARVRPMIMAFDDPCVRSDDDERPFSDVIGEAVNQYLGEMPSTEIIGVLETAKACVISKAIKELRGED